MQDRYVGDVGDFGKYGLLRVIGRDLKLGVVWYLVPDEGHNDDGKHTTYLNLTAKNLAQYRACDSELYDTLGAIIDVGQRSVVSVRQAGLLPSSTAFFEDRLTFAGMPGIGPAALDRRLRHRRRWAGDALAETAGSDLVFLDPDNGFESGTKRHVAKGPKYVYFDEVQPFLDRGQSVVVYHHLHRNFPHPTQVTIMLDRLRSMLKGCGSIHALQFGRGSTRVFFVIPAPEHEMLFRDRVTRFARSPWSLHFSDVSGYGQHPIAV